MALNSLPLGRIVEGDALEVLRGFPSCSVQTVCTSPPYWGLRNYGQAGQYGLESTPDEHVAVMVAVFREVRRVLRDDGTCWVNYGDCFASGGGSGKQGQTGQRADRRFTAEASGVLTRPGKGLEAKDLVGMPWRVAFALQADGWWLRRDIIWHKPNPMPESVTDRPATAHEYVFLLTKRARYFYDADAVREPNTEAGIRRAMCPSGAGFANEGSFHDHADDGSRGQRIQHPGVNPAGRSLRSVWTIPTQPYPGAHFATFPERVVVPCLKAGTSEKGACAACGAPWRRVVEKAQPPPAEMRNRGNGSKMDFHSRSTGGGQKIQDWYDAHPATTTGWTATCGCGPHPPAPSPGGEGGNGAPPEKGLVPCVVMDPFAGSGTVGIVAAKLGLGFVGIDLAGGDTDMGGHTAHERIAAALEGRRLDDWQAHRRLGQMDLLDGMET